MSDATGAAASRPTLDHLVYGVRDLISAMDDLEHRIGVRPAIGGKHTGRGTHNALLSLGSGAYLELLAIDPDQERPSGSETIELLESQSPSLMSWAIRTTDIDGLVERSRAAGYDPGRIQTMRRARPDGVILEWRLTSDPPAWPGALVPFVIDWASSPHPSESSPGGARVHHLRAEHPHPDAVTPALKALDAGLSVTRGPRPVLIATIECPNGLVELR